MSDDDLIILDSDDEVIPKGRQTVEEVILSDADSSDDIQIEEIVLKGDIQYMGRGKGSIFKNRRHHRNKQRENSRERSGEQLMSSESDQSQVNITRNGLKNELITPPKNPPNIVLKSSPHFESTNQSSIQSSSEPLIEASDDSNSQFSSQHFIQSETSVHSSVITSTVPSLQCVSQPLDETISVSQNVTAVEKPTLQVQTNDFEVEDQVENETDCDSSICESELLLSPTPLERTSTPIVTSKADEPVVHKSDISIQTSPLKAINETSNENIVNSPNETLKSSENIFNDSNSLNKSLNDLKNDEKTRIGIGIGTENMIRRLDFEEPEFDQPVGEYYICSYAECGKEFNNALLHYKHEKKHSNELIRRKIRTFKCRYVDCPFTGLTQVELIFHNSEHMGIFLCQKPDCEFRAKNSDDLSQHLRFHRNSKKRSLRKKGIFCECGQSSCV